MVEILKYLIFYRALHVTIFLYTPNNIHIFLMSLCKITLLTCNCVICVSLNTFKLNLHNKENASNVSKALSCRQIYGPSSKHTSTVRGVKDERHSMYESEAQGGIIYPLYYCIFYMKSINQNICGHL